MKTKTRWARRTPGGPWWLALLLVPLLLGALVAGVAHGSIQDKLTAKAKAALDAKGLNATSVKFNGRDGKITLPAGTDATAAKDAVEGVSGVRIADVTGGGSADSGKAGAPTGAAAPYSLSNDGKSVTVTATVPDQKAKAALIDGVTSAVAPTPVVDLVTIKSGAVAPAAGALGSLAGSMAKSAGTQAKWDGTNLTLTGKVADQATKQAIGAAATATASGTVDNQITVAAASNGNSNGNAAACTGLDAKLAAAQQGAKIQFTPGSSVITASSAKALSAIGTLLKGCPSAKVEVGGYTDNQGNAATSQPLSQRRANAVRAALVQRGVSANAVTAKGYGESNPIASNATDAGRAANRRVEIKVQ